MLAGWRGYFEWLPDYIEVTDVFEGDDTLALFGVAGGSFKNKETESWRLPAAWKGSVKDGRVALWQVFADTRIPFEIIECNQRWSVNRSLGSRITRSSASKNGLCW